MDYIRQAEKIADHFQVLLADAAAQTKYDAISERLPVTIALAFEAGAIMLPIYHQARQGQGVLELIDKHDRADGYSSPLTVADSLVHARTFKIYSSKFPDDRFEGEESKHIAKNARVTLVQDEIDGTQNFATGCGSFSYVNALYVKNEATGEDRHMTSLVYDPLHRVLFAAVSGRGAFRFELSEKHEVIYARSIQVANLDVRTAATPPYILMDTMGLAEDPVLRRVLQKLGYGVEPLSGSGLKVAAVASEAVICAVFRSQRGNPDPWDVAAASLLVTEGKVTENGWEQNRGRATSLSGTKMLDAERKFYDGYAIAAPLAHSHIVTAHRLIEKALTEKGITQNDMTPKQWDGLAEQIAADVRRQCF